MGKTNFFISWQRKKRVQSRHSGLTAKMKEGIKKKKKKDAVIWKSLCWLLVLATGPGYICTQKHKLTKASPSRYHPSQHPQSTVTQPALACTLSATAATMMEREGRVPQRNVEANVH